MSTINEVSPTTVIFERTSPFEDRAQKTIRRAISLTKQDPIERLKEFCKQGLYKYRYTWDIFSNGILCSCCIYISLSGARRNEVAKETRFIAALDIKQAQRVVTAILLDRMGLGEETLEGEDDKAGEDTETEEDTETDVMGEMHGLARGAMKLASKVIASQLQSAVSTSPSTTEGNSGSENLNPTSFLPIQQLSELMSNLVTQ